MKFRIVAVTALLGLFQSGLFAQAPLINSLNPNGQLTWTLPFDAKTNGVARVESATDLLGARWIPYAYDFISTNLYPPTNWPAPSYTVPTNATRTLQVPIAQSGRAFYRVAAQTNIPDPSLVMYLPFNNDLSTGVMLDASGHANHGYRYQTNRWPSVTTGPGGSVAAEFHIYPDPFFTPVPTNGSGPYGISGDYVVVGHNPNLDNLTNATIAVWAHYYAYNTQEQNLPITSTLISAGWSDTLNSWNLGRLNSYNTALWMNYSGSGSATILTFPDYAPTGDTGGWHHYAVTFDGTNIAGYFDGTNFTSFTTPWLSKLVLGGTFIGIGCWNYNSTPQLYDADKQPNIGWITGALCDMRIYNRALSAPEILSLYSRFDTQPPTLPSNLTVRAASSSQIELRWSPSTDNFIVAGYSIRRNGTLVGTTAGTFYDDTGLTAGTQYSYTIEAFDGAGNRSGQCTPVVTNTPTAGAAVDVIVDDGDGTPWIGVAGTWNTESEAFLPNTYWLGCLVGTVGNGAQSVTFRPNLPETGNYQVSVWYGGVGGPNFPYYLAPPAAPVDIIGGGITNNVSLNEQQYYGTWFSLGTFAFDAGTNGFVRIRTDGTSGYYVNADAVRFTK